MIMIFENTGRMSMKRNVFKQNSVRFRSPGVCIVLLLSLSAMITGCAGVYGRLASDPVIFDQYRAGSLPENYQYFFSGRPGLPDAVAGIDESYQLQGRLWFRIDTMNTVYDKIRNLSDLNPEATALQTADILDNHGNKIGVWFSYYYYAPVRIDPENRIVEILDPSTPSGGFGRTGP
jgi:hypothetical protein